MLISKCTTVSEFQPYRNLEADFLKSSPSMKKKKLLSGQETWRHLRLETGDSYRAAADDSGLQVHKNSRQDVISHFVHLHGHSVCVCVLLLYPLKDLPFFFFFPNLTDVGSGLDVSSFINMYICGHTVSCCTVAQSSIWI